MSRKKKPECVCGPCRATRCGGTGMLDCWCGGETCICLACGCGEIECDGCDDCKETDDEYYGGGGETCDV